jgi:hypothetical protein
MSEFKTGDKIEHRLMPGFTMIVLDARPCETTPFPEHQQYKVTDPEGNEDWFCANDVQQPGESLPWGA